MAMVEAVGGSGTLAVTTQPECAWEASTTASWISGLSPASGQGVGNVTFRVAPNEGTSARDANIVVNGQQARVSQRAPCRYELAPANQSIATSGGESSVTVTTLSDCAWTATTDVNWITLAAPLGGSGNGVVSFSVVPNPGAARSGVITVAGQRANVVQAAAAPTPCVATISPTSQNIAAAGGPGGPVFISTANNCSWTAVSTASWITVTSGASGIGEGQVTFSVAPNTGAARTGTLTIAARTFTVAQAAAAAPPPPPPPACTYSIAPNSQNADAAAGTGAVTVTAGVACAWTAVSNAAWLTITAGAAGAGNGAVAFTIAANTGAARSGTLTIAGQVFTVTQAAPAAPPPPPPPPPACTYVIAPGNQNFTALGGSGNVGVTATGSNCNWTASSNAAWIGVTSGSPGSGNGTVGFSVAVNLGAARSGTLTVAGQVFTVTQDAVLGGLR